MTDDNFMDKFQIEHLPIFFIVGRPRSGTTLLRTFFDAHPNVNISLEAPFIQNLYPKYGKLKFWDKKKLTSFYNDLLIQPAFNLWTIDRKRLKNDLLSCTGETPFRTLCKVVSYNYKSFFEKKEIVLLGDKNPIYSLFIYKLVEIFPEAKFIHILRDYRDNILSMINARFEAPLISSLAYRWVYYNKKIQKTKEKEPHRFYTIKYEDLVTQPSYFLEDICKFLDIEYTPVMLDFQKKADEALKVYPRESVEKVHKSLFFQPISADKVYSWKNKMAERKIKIADSIVGHYAEFFGYNRKYKSKIHYFLNLFGVIYGRLYFTFLTLEQKLPFKLKMSLIHLLARIYGVGWKKFKMNISETSIKSNLSNGLRVYEVSTCRDANLNEK